MINLNALDDEIERLLVARGVRSLDSYYFNSSEDRARGYAGYEMWNLTPPYEEDYEAWQSRTLPKRTASEHEQRLVVLGEDFQGLLRAIRYAIGCMLLHRAVILKQRPLPNPFEFHELSALLFIGSAIDRFRDFLIAAGWARPSSAAKRQANSQPHCINARWLCLRTSINGARSLPR